MEEYVLHRKRATNGDWWKPRTYDRYGYDEDGYDRHGYDRSGYDRDGFNRYGRDRFGRIAADAGNPPPWRGIDIETLPSQLTRLLLPHYSDWIVVDPEKTRYQQLGEKMRLFVLGKKGWQPASSLSGVALGQKHYAVARRQPRRIFSGGSFFRPAAPSHPPAAAVARPGSAGYDVLYRDYIHHSHQYHRGELNGGWVEAARNLTNTNAPNAGGRTIFANVPERGNSSDLHGLQLTNDQSVESL